MSNSRLRTVEWEFIVADDALRKTMIENERHVATIKRLQHLMRPANPDRVTINGQVHSIPLGMRPSDYLRTITARL